MRPAPPTEALSRGKALLPWAAVAACCLLTVAGLLLHPSRTPSPENLDWAEVAFHHASVRDSVLGRGELPWYSPYVNGGYPLASYPQSPSLSLFLPLTLAFGEHYGPRATTALVYLLGVLGMALFCRRGLGMQAWPAAFAAGLFAASGWLAARVAGGNFSQVFYYLFPLAAHLLFAAAKRPVLLVPLTLVLYSWLAEAKYAHPICLCFLGLAALVLGEMPLRGRMKLVGLLVGATALSALLGTLKIALMLDLLSRTPPSADYLETKAALLATGIGPGGFLWLFASGMANVKVLSREALALVSARPMLLGNGYLGCGLIPLALALSSFAFLFRRSRGLLALFALSLALCAAPFLPLDPFLPLSGLPFFRSMGDPAKYVNFFLLFSICAGAGFFAELYAERLRGKKARAAAGIALAVVVALPLFANGRVFFHAFPARERQEQRVQGFFQVLSGPPYRDYKKGVGVIDWYTRLPIPTRVEPRFASLSEPAPNPRYRGEAYALYTGLPAAAAFTYNRIEIADPPPGRTIINLNWLPGMTAENGRAEPWMGLISVTPDRPHAPAALRYRPPGLRLHAALSLAGLLILLGLCPILVRRGKTRKAPHGS